MIDPEYIPSILWWIVSGSTWLSSQRTVADMQALDVSWSGTLSVSRLSNMPGVVFHKIFSSPLQRAGPCSIPFGGLSCDSATGACHIFHMASFPATATSNIIGFADVYSPSGRAHYSRFWHDVESYLALGPTLSWQPFLSLSTWARSIFPGMKHAASKTHRGLLGIAFSKFMVGGVRCHHLSFTLAGMSWHAHDHWLPKNFSDVEEFWIFMRFISHPVEPIYLNKASNMLSLLAHPTWLAWDSGSAWYSAGIETVQNTVDYIVTEGVRVNIAPRQKSKSILLYITCVCRLFLILFSARDRKTRIPQMKGHMPPGVLGHINQR